MGICSAKSIYLPKIIISHFPSKVNRKNEKNGEKTMKIKYVSQCIKFFELQTEYQISSNAQALYYALLNINNKCNWKEDFTVANSVLMLYTMLSISALQRARNELVQKKLITYKKGKGNQAGFYTLKKLYVENS